LHRCACAISRGADEWPDWRLPISQGTREGTGRTGKSLVGRHRCLRNNFEWSEQTELQLQFSRPASCIRKSQGSDAREIPRSRPGRQPRTDTPREEARLKIVEARKARTAEREAARIQREKALEQGAREAERLAEEQRAGAELAQRVAREKAEEQAKIAAEQKLARDARYAARKAAKKQRRQQQKERQPLR